MSLTEKEYDALSYEKKIEFFHSVYRQLEFITENKLFDVKNFTITLELKQEAVDYIDSVHPNGYIEDGLDDNTYTINIGNDGSRISRRWTERKLE